MGVVVVVLIAASYSVWTYLNYLDYSNKTVHETLRWAVITDLKSDIIAVETTRNEVWNTLTDLHQNQTAMWIGGIVEEYDNTWGFRFKPDTLTIAEVTAEGAQTTIRDISENLDYWISTWGTLTYVFGTISEIHETP